MNSTTEGIIGIVFILLGTVALLFPRKVIALRARFGGFNPLDAFEGIYSSPLGPFVIRISGCLGIFVGVLLLAVR